MKKKISLCILENRIITCMGYLSVLKGNKTIKVNYIANSFEELFSNAQIHKPDVFLLNSSNLIIGGELFRNN